VLIPDTNVFLYAVDSDSPFCETARGWLDAKLSTETGGGSNLTSDAHLAALAI
jgi:predicted nucleic acid-binding protein